MSLWRRLLGHRSASIGLALVLMAMLVAILAEVIAPFDPIVQYRQASGKPPGTTVTVQSIDAGSDNATRFALGTDINGRDILSRVIFGSRISLAVGFVATILALLMGALIGTLAGYYGGWLDMLLMRTTDIFFAFPGILLAIVTLATLNQPVVREALVATTGITDPGIWGLFIVLGLTGWPAAARIVRSEVLTLKEREFVEAARAMGCNPRRIMMVHLVPNYLPQLIVVGTFFIADFILAESGLSFLGLGIQPPAASWGVMLAESRPYLATMPWWGVFPGIALALTVLGFNLFGDGLRDLLDPRLRSRTG